MNLNYKQGECDEKRINMWYLASDWGEQEQNSLSATRISCIACAKRDCQMIVISWMMQFTAMCLLNLP